MVKELPDTKERPLTIKVIGIGGLGVATVGTMTRRSSIAGIDYLGVDMHVLDHPDYSCPGIPLLYLSPASRGLDYTRDAVMEAARASSFTSKLRAAIDGADIVVIAAAMGRKTGTGASPEVAKIAREAGALVLAFVTAPSCLHGKKGNQTAAEGLARLSREVDKVIIIPCDSLLQQYGEFRGCFDHYSVQASVMAEGIASVIEALNVPGLVNPERADIEKVMCIAGEGAMSIGAGSCISFTADAVHDALYSRIFRNQLARAKGLLLCLCGCPDVTLPEYAEAVELVASMDERVTHIELYVSTPVEKLWEIHSGHPAKMRLTLIATGLNQMPRGLLWWQISDPRLL